MALGDSSAPQPAAMPPAAQSAYERLARWAHDRAHDGAATVVRDEGRPERRQRLVNEALLATVALLLDGASDDTVVRLHAALDRVVLGGPPPAAAPGPMLGVAVEDIRAGMVVDIELDPATGNLRARPAVPH